MNSRSIIRSILGGLLFILGMLAGLGLSSGILWSELEAFSQEGAADGGRLHLDCPPMLSSDETGVVSASIANSIDVTVNPVVSAEISGNPRSDQTLSLAPGEAKRMEWTVDSSDREFDRIIRVNIYQRRYRELVPRAGSCGILFISLFGLSGIGTYSLIVVLSLGSMILGGYLWISARPLLTETHASFLNASRFLGGLVLASLISSLLRWWGLTLLFNALAVLMIGVIITEFILHPRNEN